MAHKYPTGALATASSSQAPGASSAREAELTDYVTPKRLSKG